MTNNSPQSATLGLHPVAVATTHFPFRFLPYTKAEMAWKRFSKLGSVAVLRSLIEYCVRTEMAEKYVKLAEIYVKLGKAAKLRTIIYDIGGRNLVPGSGLWSGSSSKVNQFVHVHQFVLSPDKTEWRLISATIRRGGRTVTSNFTVVSFTRSSAAERPRGASCHWIFF